MSGDSERDSPTEREKFYAAFPRHAGVLEMMEAGAIPMLDSMTARHQFAVWQACAELKDKEIEQLNAALDAKITICGDERVHQLQAKLAMMSEALIECSYSNSTDKAQLMTHKALTATEQDVSAWRKECEAKAIEECKQAILNGVFIHDESPPKRFAFEVAGMLDRLAEDRRSEGK